jgi:hypothetical protein
LSGLCERIELTMYSRGPIIRAEAAAGDVYAALDLATAKLEERLRRAADRRHARQHGHAHGGHGGHGNGGRGAALDAVGLLPGELVPNGSGPASNGGQPVDVPAPAASVDPDAPEPEDLGDVLVADGPLVVRQKVHEAEPMTLDEALHHMELVGHDFFLYSDAACGLPSVVYRRRGYTYGVLRLQTETTKASDAIPASTA